MVGVLFSYHRVAFVIFSVEKQGLFYAQMIRGRLCDDTKPETFNQLWTVEEQVSTLEQCSLRGKLWLMFEAILQITHLLLYVGV